MAFGATIISFVTFIIFLIFTILAFMAYSDIDLLVCTGQSIYLESARGYILGVALINLAMMLVILVAGGIGYGSLLKKSDERISQSLVVLAIAYIITFAVTCLLSAIAYAKLASSACIMSTVPNAQSNALILLVVSGILAVLYFLFLIIRYRDDLRELIGSSGASGSSSSSKSGKGLSSDEKARRGRDLMARIPDPADWETLTPEELSYIQAANEKRKKVKELAAGVNPKNGGDKRDKRVAFDPTAGAFPPGFPSAMKPMVPIPAAATAGAG